MNEGLSGRSDPSADLIRAIARRDGRRAKDGGPAREGMVSLMFGAPSLAIGLFVMFVAVTGLADMPVEGWTKPYPIMMDDEYGMEEVEWRTIEAPSKSCAAMALVGIGLGAAGAALEWSKARRRGALISVAGAVLSAVAIGVPLLLCAILNLVM